jgi:very-short-patch-repair endonuclease
LRREETEAESALWEALRGRQLSNLKFRRQHPLGRFVLDFVCPSAKLVIELDGSSHEGRQEYDAARTEQLTRYGYRILRYRNESVLSHLGIVLEDIVRAAGVKAFAHTPPPKLGEGTGERA